MPDSADHEPVNSNVAGDLYEKARHLMAAGRLEEAVVAFGQSVAIVPHFKCLELMGECLLELGRPINAVVPLAAATTLNRQIRAPSLLARALLEIGEFHHAAEIAQIVISRAPGNRNAMAVLAHPSVAKVLAENEKDGAA